MNGTAPAPRPRVLSVPSRHPFVDATWPAETELIWPAALPDDGRWHPHPALQAAWLYEHADEVDAVHVHFGYEHLSPAQIRDFTTACADTGTALIVTVHDIDNPHLSDQRDHHARLEALTASAAAVFTLTDSAAAVLATRWGVRAEVIAHPPVVPAAQAAEVVTGAGRPGRSAAVFLKDVRTNVVTEPRFYLQLAHGLHRAGAWLEVWAHRSSAHHPLLTALQAAVDRGTAPGLDIHLTDRLADRQLFQALAGCAAAVLPYTHGTHSGWLEMSRDLGLSVIAPDCGHYAAQADVPEAVRTYPSGDGDAAAQAAIWAIRRGRLPRANLDGRAAAAQQAYGRAYARACARATRSVPAGGPLAPVVCAEPRRPAAAPVVSAEPHRPATAPAVATAAVTPAAAAPAAAAHAGGGC